MTKTNGSYQDRMHKNLLRDRYLSDFKQPGRLRAEWERVKKLIRGNRP